MAGDYASEKKISLLTVMEKKQKKIHALMQGQTIPFKALFVIRVWDKSKDGLNAKASAIKNAINSMNSAQYFESNLPSTSKNLFFQTWPGWTWGRYEHRKLYSEHRYLADMLPVASTFTGHLKTAEAIYDGPNNNLIGVETFSGSKDNQSPQHAVLLGMSGAGKSVTVCDLLSQTEGYFAYTVIIEEGLSYGILMPTSASSRLKNQNCWTILSTSPSPMCRSAITPSMTRVGMISSFPSTTISLPPRSTRCVRAAC